jgi:amino acid transporter
MPERIATHFNGAGVANGFGARSTLWVLVGIAFLLYWTLSLINIVPRAVNLRRPLLPEREKVVLAESMAMVGWIKVEVCWMFAYLCLAMVRNGMGLQKGLGAWFLPVTLVVVFGTCAFYLVRIFGAIRGAGLGCD